LPGLRAVGEIVLFNGGGSGTEKEQEQHAVVNHLI
jgi:hypothetical protein